MQDHTETFFAPAERLPADQILVQARAVADKPFVTGLLDAVGTPMVVLNAERQIVHANTAFCKTLGTDAQSVLGARPGEAVGCVHARTCAGGCGTSRSCSLCGAVNAIRESQATGRTFTRECSLSLESGDAAEFLVTASPFAADGTTFSVCTFQDIGDQKRRRSLERIFFHDVVNTASSIRGFAELLKKAQPPKSDEYRDMVEGLTDALLDEIKAHKELVAAEQNELVVRPVRLDSVLVVTACAQRYQRQEQALGRRVAVDPDAMNVPFVSDRTLVTRVLVNLIKNAVEATPEGGTVTCGCGPEAQGRILFWVHNPGAMPENVRLQVFKRSFSTKGRDRGLGTYSIRLLTTRYLGGRVWFESSEADGTTFFVALPKKIQGPEAGIPSS